jgi:hypothetical protein
MVVCLILGSLVAGWKDFFSSRNDGGGGYYVPLFIHNIFITVIAGLVFGIFFLWIFRFITR